jgi:hypothetical protein
MGTFLSAVHSRRAMRLSICESEAVLADEKQVLSQLTYTPATD